MSSKYFKLKNLFIDCIDSSNFIDLGKSRIAYDKIMDSLAKPLKLVLFYGKPGSGKSFLLKKVKTDLLSSHKRVVLLDQPFYDEITFYKVLFYNLFSENLTFDDYYDFIIKYKERLKISDSELKEDSSIILLDEAQLYPDLLIEKIRLLSDTRMFKFLFTVHKTIAKEDILAQNHFTTRIWESIEMLDANEIEIKTYILKKLELFANLIGKDFFDSNNYNFIYKVTNGNLRTVNKLLYKTFEIFEFYEQAKPSELTINKINQKILEMAAIDQGLIDA